MGPVAASAVAIGLVASFAACGADESGANGRSSSRDGGGAGREGGSDIFTDDIVPSEDDGCAEEARLVYVLTTSDSLYSFDPGKLKFEFVGALSCATAARPNSMAVDRSGIAWVNYTDGSLFKVNTRTAGCEPTPFVAPMGFGKVGMAFSSNGAGAREETLFVVSLTGAGVGKIDTSTYQLQRIGDFSDELAQRGAELTGTGDGKLFGFVTTTPASLAEIDKATGATPRVSPLPNMTTGVDYAFSFWGGDFWFYTAGSEGSTSQSSRVTQYKLSSSRQLTVVNPSVGFRIVGAGVSTCAPVAPPK